MTLASQVALLATRIGQEIKAVRAEAVGSLPAAPATTGSAGTASSGVTETRDAILGNYVFTAVAGHRYRVILDSAIISGSVIGDLYRVNIRNGGASTPTAVSTAVATAQAYTTVAGGGGQVSIRPAGTFVPGAGTQTLSVFVARMAGTGIGTIVAPGVARQLYVVDMGLN